VDFDCYLYNRVKINSNHILGQDLAKPAGGTYNASDWQDKKNCNRFACFSLGILDLYNLQSVTKNFPSWPLYIFAATVA
jgi:hypothetical protein